MLRGTLAELAEAIAGRELKGEIVLVVGRGVEEQPEQDVEAALRAELDQASVKEAVARVAERLNLPRRQVYQLALTLEGRK